MASNVVPMPLADLEDRLVNTRALLNFCRHRIEAESDEEFRLSKADFCTMFYLIGDQVTGMEVDLEKIYRRKPLSTLMKEGSA